ncbi:MAG TPA: NADP oxidoreductase, partial [Demequinaceae bacterium]
PIAGDDDGAKAFAARFLNDLGYDAVDIGPLAESWRVERDTPAYGVRSTVDELRTLAAKAERVQQV